MPDRPEQTDEERARSQAEFWDGLDAHDRGLELRRFVPAETLGTLLRCPVCGKDLRAREHCAACGDETDVAA